MKAIGFPFCCSTASMSFPDAYVSMIKISLKFGMERTGVLVMACLSFTKASYASLFKPNCPFLRRLVSGLANKQ